MATSAADMGVGLSLLTAALWAVSPMLWDSVGRRIGSHHTNLLRLLAASAMLGLLVLPAYAWARGGASWPTGPQFTSLFLSSIAGMVIGDALFYEALIRLGARRTVKLLTLAPALALGIAWFWLGEQLTPLALSGAALVIGGVVYATMIETNRGQPTREPGRVTPAGLAFAGGAAVGGAWGAVLLRQAFQQAAPTPLDAIVAATVRVVSAAVVMWGLAAFSGDARRAPVHLADAGVRKRILAGTLFGPVGGILCYVLAMKHAQAGLVSTLSSTSPLLIIPLTAWKYRVRIRLDIVLATIVAVAGIAMISIGQRR